MRVFLVRHGQTLHNVERRIQGPLLDDPLNAHGQLQAAALERHFATLHASGLRLRRVYASPLKRAWMTAEALARGAGIEPPHPEPGFIEYSWGIYLGKQEQGDVLDALRLAHERWAAGELDYAPPEGESITAAWERASGAFRNVVARHFDGADHDGDHTESGHGAVAMVAHGRINKILLAGLVNGDLRTMDDFPQGNTSVTLLESVPGADLSGDLKKAWRIVYLNKQDHLHGDAADPVPSHGRHKPLV